MKDFLAQTLLPMLLPMGILGAFALVGFLGAHGVAWLKAKAGTSKMALFAATVADHTLGAFGVVEARLKPMLLAAMADGKLSPEEAAGIKKAIADTILASLPGYIRAIGETMFGDALPSVVSAQAQAAAASSPAIAAIAPTAVAALAAPVVNGVVRPATVPFQTPR